MPPSHTSVHLVKIQQSDLQLQRQSTICHTQLINSQGPTSNVMVQHRWDENLTFHVVTIDSRTARGKPRPYWIHAIDIYFPVWHPHIMWGPQLSSHYDSSSHKSLWQKTFNTSSTAQQQRQLQTDLLPTSDHIIRDFRICRYKQP